MSPYNEQRRDRAAAEYIHEVERRGDSAWLYVNARTPVPILCGRCGHVWEAMPRNYRAGKGCPVCAESGFNPDAPGFLYLIAHREAQALKVGITNVPEGRLATHKRNGYTTLRVLFHPDGRRVRELERDVIRTLNALGCKPVPDAPKDGRTETVPLSTLDLALTVFKTAVHDVEQSGGGDVTDQFVQARPGR